MRSLILPAFLALFLIPAVSADLLDFDIPEFTIDGLSSSDGTNTVQPVDSSIWTESGSEWDTEEEPTVDINKLWGDLTSSVQEETGIAAPSLGDLSTGSYSDTSDPWSTSSDTDAWQIPTSLTDPFQSPTGFTGCLIPEDLYSPTTDDGTSTVTNGAEGGRLRMFQGFLTNGESSKQAFGLAFRQGQGMLRIQGQTYRLTNVTFQRNTMESTSLSASNLFGSVAPEIVADREAVGTVTAEVVGADDTIDQTSTSDFLASLGTSSYGSSGTLQATLYRVRGGQGKKGRVVLEGQVQTGSTAGNFVARPARRGRGRGPRGKGRHGRRRAMVGQGHASSNLGEADHEAMYMNWLNED